MKKKRVLCIISIVLVIVSYVGLGWIMINEESGRGSMDDIRWICFFLVLGSIGISIVIIQLLEELYLLMRNKKKKYSFNKCKPEIIKSIQLAKEHVKKKKIFYIIDTIWIIGSVILLIILFSAPCDTGLAVLERAGWFLLSIYMMIIGIVALLIPSIIELIKSGFSERKDKKLKSDKNLKLNERSC